jgi:hypothetical protein
VSDRSQAELVRVLPIDGSGMAAVLTPLAAGEAATLLRLLSKLSGGER